MILKCKRNVSSEGLSVHRLYPVIAYAIDIDKEMKQYQVVDDCRSLSWKSIDFFEVISDRLDNFKKLNNTGNRTEYIYADLFEKDFFVNYYSENENSIATNRKLEEALISILSKELTSKDLVQNLNMVGYSNDSADLLLKAFFRQANRQDIISFAKNIYNKIEELNSYIVQIIVENLIPYKESDIESLFIQVYMDDLLCNKDTIKMIDGYLGTQSGK